MENGTRKCREEVLRMERTLNSQATHALWVQNTPNDDALYLPSFLHQGRL